MLEVGESVLVGDINVTVEKTRRHHRQTVQLIVDGVPTSWMARRQSLSLSNGATLSISRIQTKRVKLFFQASPVIRILRTELLRQMTDMGSDNMLTEITDEHETDID